MDSGGIASNGWGSGRGEDDLIASAELVARFAKLAINGYGTVADELLNVRS